MHRAADALAELAGVLDRYPEARRDLERAVGRDGAVELSAIGARLAALAAALDRVAGGVGETGDPG